MPISLVKDGDAIEIDIKGKIDLDISRPEIRKRQIFKVLIKQPCTDPIDCILTKSSRYQFFNRNFVEL